MGMIRKLILEARDRLDRKEERNNLIFRRFFNVLPKETERVFIFVGTGSEASTLPIIEKLLDMGISVFCPKVIGRDIEFFEIKALSDLAPGRYNIPEPDVEEPGRLIEEIVEEKAAYPDDSISCLMVMPGVVFDETGGRMGYGAGMYDRYLENRPCFKIALAYEVQVREKPLVLMPTDVKIDALITERCLRRFSGDKGERQPGGDA